jgi:hypothetical protein
MGMGKKAQDAKEALFKRLYGVKPAEFSQMLSILQKEFDKMHKSGGIRRMQRHGVPGCPMGGRYPCKRRHIHAAWEKSPQEKVRLN